MKTALSFFILFIIGFGFSRFVRAQNAIPVYSFAEATATILSPASIEMKQLQDIDVLELPALILRLGLYEKNPGRGAEQSVPSLTMNLVEFTLTDNSSQQFAVTLPSNATAISTVNGKSYVTPTQSLSIISDQNIVQPGRQAFKVKGSLLFNQHPIAINKEPLSPLMVTVNFN